MHRTLKLEATRPAGSNFLQQQAKFDAFIHEFNHERPHEALDMKYPGEVYKPSTRPYQGIGELSYPFHDRTVLVTYCARICIFKKKINLSTSLAGQAVGIKEVDDGIWLVSFLDLQQLNIVEAGESKQIVLLKTRNLLISRDAQNAKNSKNAANWNVPSLRLPERVAGQPALSLLRTGLACCCQIVLIKRLPDQGLDYGLAANV